MGQSKGVSVSATIFQHFLCTVCYIYIILYFNISETPFLFQDVCKEGTTKLFNTGAEGEGKYTMFTA